MNEQYLEYVLNTLEEADLERFETFLRENPDAKNDLRKLQAALAPLSYDADPALPPAGLADRTLAYIETHVGAEHATGARTLPKAPMAHGEGGIIGRSWWRRADLVVAACLLLMSIGIVIPVIARLRGPSSSATLAACQNNLREFFAALTVYRDAHKSYPDPQKEAPYDVAGIVVPMLTEAGTLSPTVSIQCPGNGPHLACTVALRSIREMTDGEFRQVAPLLSRCYAYSLGYRDEEGKYHSPGGSLTLASAMIPLMADRAPADGSDSNSINHGGAGQNILFLDGSVRFANVRTVGFQADDIYTNQHHQVAAGVGPFDAVLGFSAARP